MQVARGNAVSDQGDRERSAGRQLVGCRLRPAGPGAALGEPALVRADDDLAGEITLEDRVHRRDRGAAGTDAVEVARLVIAAAVQRIAVIFGGVDAGARMVDLEAGNDRIG